MASFLTSSSAHALPEHPRLFRPVDDGQFASPGNPFSSPYCRPDGCVRGCRMEFLTPLGRLSTAHARFTDFSLFARLLGCRQDSLLSADRCDRCFVPHRSPPRRTAPSWNARGAVLSRCPGELESDCRLSLLPRLERSRAVRYELWVMVDATTKWAGCD